MWLITTQGFYSGVQDPTDSNIIVVRGRVHADMKALVQMLPKDARPKIIDNEGTDYPYRVRVSRAQWVRLCCNLAMDVDYGNFKDAVKARQGKKRAEAYMGIWSILNRLTPYRVTQKHWERRARSRRAHRPAGQRAFFDGHLDEGFPWE